MGKQTRQLIADYEKAINAIANAFLAKQNDADYEPPMTVDDGNVYWAADDVGGVLCIGDTYFYEFADILTSMKEAAPAGEIDRFYDYFIDCRILGLSTMNFHAWLHGAPRFTDEQIETAKKLRKEFANGKQGI